MGNLPARPHPEPAKGIAFEKSLPKRAEVGKRVQISCMLALCILGCGAQWDLLQLFAWGRMFAEHAQSMSVTAAVRKTFDGEMCPLCRFVASAKQQQARTPAPAVKGDTKLQLFFHAPAVVVVEKPVCLGWREAGSAAWISADLAPPVPPPRQAVL